MNYEVSYLWKTAPESLMLCICILNFLNGGVTLRGSHFNSFKLGIGWLNIRRNQLPKPFLSLVLEHLTDGWRLASYYSMMLLLNWLNWGSTWSGERSRSNETSCTSMERCDYLASWVACNTSRTKWGIWVSCSWSTWKYFIKRHNCCSPQIVWTN